MGGLDDMIASAHSLERMNERVAQKAAEKLQKATTETASAGESPDGKAWAPKKDGGRPMANAAAHVQTAAYSDVVKQTLTGPDVFHQFGVRGEPKRTVIPDSGAGVPEHVEQILEQASEEVFEELTGAR